jgi:YHS domain-containing protein
MKVDRAKAIHAHGHFFCSEHCRAAFEADGGEPDAHRAPLASHH